MKEPQSVVVSSVLSSASIFSFKNIISTCALALPSQLSKYLQWNLSISRTLLPMHCMIWCIAAHMPRCFLLKPKSDFRAISDTPDRWRYILAHRKEYAFYPR